MYREDKFKEFINNLKENQLLNYFFQEIMGLDIRNDDYAYRITSEGIDIFYERHYFRYVFTKNKQARVIKIQKALNYTCYTLSPCRCAQIVAKGKSSLPLIVFTSIFDTSLNYQLLNKKIHSYITMYLL